MKTFNLILILFVISITNSMGQATKCRATYMSSMVHPSTTWSEWQPCSLLVVHNEQRVTIYSEVTQTYDILSSTDEYKDVNGYDTIDFTAINEDGTKVECNMTHVLTKNPDRDEMHFYIMLPKFTICYSLEDIE